MRTNAAGIDLIKRHEGFSAKIYEDAAGFATIGYGHLVLPHEDFSEGITHEMAEALLEKDIFIAEKAVTKLIRRNLNNNQFAALVSFTFNLGGAAFERSTLRRKVNGGYDAEVPYEFMKWVFAGGRKLKGLIKRRSEEAELYLL